MAKVIRFQTFAEKAEILNHFDFRQPNFCKCLVIEGKNQFTTHFSPTNST